MSAYREPTVAELIEQLQQQPQHYPVSIIVNGMAGVVTGVWCQSIESASMPYVLIGEREAADAIVPPVWNEASE